MAKEYSVLVLKQIGSCKASHIAHKHQVKSFPSVLECCKSLKLPIQSTVYKKKKKKKEEAEIDLFWRRFGGIALIIRILHRGVEAPWIRIYLSVGNYPTGYGGIH